MLLSREAENELWYNLVHNTNRDDAQRLLTAIDEGRVVGSEYISSNRAGCGCVYYHLIGAPEVSSEWDNRISKIVEQIIDHFEHVRFVAQYSLTYFEADLLRAFVDSEDGPEPFLNAVRELVYDVYPELLPVVEVVE
jgi:hypothetical protein